MDDIKLFVQLQELWRRFGVLGRRNFLNSFFKGLHNTNNCATSLKSNKKTSKINLFLTQPTTCYHSSKSHPTLATWTTIPTRSAQLDLETENLLLLSCTECERAVDHSGNHTTTRDYFVPVLSFLHSWFSSVSRSNLSGGTNWTLNHPTVVHLDLIPVASTRWHSQ